MLLTPLSPRSEWVWKFPSQKYLSALNEAVGANPSSSGSRHDSISELDNKTRFGPACNAAVWLKGCDPKAVESRSQPVLFGGPVDANNVNPGASALPGHAANGGRQVSPEAASTNGSNALFRESSSSSSTSSRYTLYNRNLINSSGNGHSNVNSGTDTKIPVERVNSRSHSINTDNWRLDRNERPSDRSDFRSNVNSKYDYDSGRGRGNSTSNHSSSAGSRNTHPHHDRHHDHGGRHGDRHDRHDRNPHHNNGHTNYYYEEPTPEWMDEPTERFSMMDLGGFADDHRGSSPQPSTSQSDSPSNSTNSNRTDDSVEGKLNEASYNSNRAGKGQKSSVPTSNSDESAVYLESLLEDMLKFTEEPAEIPIQQASVHDSPVTNFGSKSSKWFSPSDETTSGGMQYQPMIHQQLHNQPQNSHSQQLQSQQHPRGHRITSASFPTSSMVPHQVLLQARQQANALAPSPGQPLKHSRSNEIPVMLSVNQQAQHSQPMNLPQMHQMHIHHQQSQMGQGKMMNQAMQEKPPADLLKLLQSGIAQPQQSPHPMYGQGPQALNPVTSDQAMIQHQLFMQRQAFQQQIQAQQQQQQQQQQHHHQQHHHPSQSLPPQPPPPQARVIHPGQVNSSDGSNMLLRLLQQSRNPGQGAPIHLAAQQPARFPFAANLPRPTQAKSLDEIERSFRSTGTALPPQSVSAFNKPSAPQSSVPVTLPGTSSESNSEDRQAFDRLIFKLQQASNMRGPK